MAVAHFTLFEHYKNQVIMPSPETVAEANRKWTEAYCTHSSESGRRGHAYDPRVYAECCKPLFGPGGLFPDGWPGGRPRGCVQVGGVFVFFGSNGGPIQAEDEDEKPK